MMPPSPDRSSILIVDDTPTNIEILFGMLEDDYELSFANSGREALSLLAKGIAPELILLDAMMPEMDGYEVMAALQQDPATRDIPVIFVTAKVDAKSEQQALDAGAVDFIHKPIHKGVVRARVRHQVELKRHRDHLEDLVEARTREILLARDAAEMANHSKEAFLSNMSHELRTPLNGIMGMTDLSLQIATDPKQKVFLEHAAQASRHLLALVNDVIDFSNIERNQLILAQTSFKLGSILESLPSLPSQRLAEKGVSFHVTIAPDLAHKTVWGDPVRLRQILSHLTGNAVKFTREGSVTVTVSLAGEEYASGLLIRFEVRDTGIGMSNEDQAELFTPFHIKDVSAARQYDGSGLGLAFSKRLVEIMGGSIGVKSQLGTGSTFWFTVMLATHAPAKH